MDFVKRRSGTVINTNKNQLLVAKKLKKKKRMENQEKLDLINKINDISKKMDHLINIVESLKDK